MAKFCKNCGRALADGEVCNCKPTFTVAGAKEIASGILKKIGKTMGLALGDEHILNPYERGQQIVADSVTSDAGEIPVKQYDLATLRSRILFKRAEGRLQVTNKRVIFRATGISLTGNTTLQHEFAVPEIAGIEIKKSHRFSFLSFFLALIGSLLINSISSAVFSGLFPTTTVISSLFIYAVALASVAAFFLLKKKFWLKLVLLAIGMSGLPIISNAIIGSNLLMGSEYIIDSLLTLPNFVGLVLDILWIFCMILVCLIPDLTVCIKTKGAGEAIQIRRKIWGLGLKQHNEFSGFSEVLPGKDTDTAIKEVGALVNDLQTMGDLAIEKWKENA